MGPPYSLSLYVRCSLISVSSEAKVSKFLFSNRINKFSADLANSFINALSILSRGEILGHIAIKDCVKFSKNTTNYLLIPLF